MLYTLRTNWLPMAIAIVGGTSIGVSPAAAQHHHHHDHDHYHDYHYDYYRHNDHYHVVPHYNYTPTYYTPSVVVNSPVTNVVPYKGVGLVLRNPEATGGTVTFTVDGYSYTMQPGYEVKLTTQPSWTLTINRGPGLGEARYVVRDGKSYAFTASPGTGWDLLEQTPSAPGTVASSPTALVSATTPAAAPVRPPAVRAEAADEAPRSQPKPPQFEPLDKGDMILVASDSAEVRNGRDVMATVIKGKQLKVLDVNSSWVMVDVGRPEFGWIHRRDVQKEAATETAPVAVRKGQ